MELCPHKPYAEDSMKTSYAQGYQEQRSSRLLSTELDALTQCSATFLSLRTGQCMNTIEHPLDLIGCDTNQGPLAQTVNDLYAAVDVVWQRLPQAANNNQCIQCLVRLRYLVQNGPMHVKLVEAQTSSGSVVWKFRKKDVSSGVILVTGLWLKVLHRKPSCLAE
ncbi:hypothetical protein TNCV_1945851 [Trichonephila clavipes]|nr:hypothetical protein TNCV_1945851 [Trichonephila clavipes]